jgi:hypothetical protein
MNHRDTEKKTKKKLEPQISQIAQIEKYLF